FRVMAERRAGPEAAAFIEANRRRLIGSCLEPQHRFAGVARFSLDPGEQRLSDTASAGRLAGVHALHFGIVVEQSDRAAARGLITEARDEEADIRLKHLLDRQAVALLRVVERAEHPVQFGDQRARIGSRAGKPLDRDLHIRLCYGYTRSITIAMPWPTPTHIATSAYLPPVRCNWRAAVRAMRGPEAPSGWPIAMAPPFGLTRLSPKSTSRPRRQAKT